MIPKRAILFTSIGVAALASAAVLRMAPAQPAEDYMLVATFPHDSEAFTEGLDFRGARLYEGTGQYGASDLRRVDLETGDVKRKKALSSKFFGEGVTQFKDRVYQLTWQENTAFVYDLQTWKRIKTFEYEGEGWGLTHNKRRLIMSNGSDQIVYRDPSTFKITKRIGVTEGGKAVQSLNELEWVKGQILANVWPNDDVVRIDPGTGNVTDRYSLKSLKDRERQSGDPAETNGIAYMTEQDRLFVTGKYWAHVYEIKLTH